MKTIQELVKNNQKSILLIVDYNISLHNGKIDSTFKIDQTLETIKYLKSQNPTILFILTHFGRPKSKNEYKVDPIFEYLQTILPEVQFLPISKFENPKKGLYFGDNLRYYTDEELTKFYKHFNIVVNEAFGSAHRPINCRCYAGFLMQKEINTLKTVKSCDLLIMGGAKANDKLVLVKKFDKTVFLGGLLAVQFMKGLGYQVGKTLETIEDSEIKKRVDCEESNRVYLPVDFLVITEFNKYEQKKVQEILKTDTIIDIGNKSIELLNKLVGNSSFILWNGPLGKFEDEHAISTKRTIEILANSNSKVVIGGGESLTAVQRFSSIEKFFHVSTGGGSMLSYLTGTSMPGIDSLE